MELDEISYGIEYGINDSNPIVTRIGNMTMHKTLPILSKYRGCVVKDGVLLYYLDPTDWSKKLPGIIAIDGGVTASTGGLVAPTASETSTLDGTDGDVCVEIPKFYGKSGTDGTKNWVRITETKVDDSWLEIPAMYVDAYKATLYTENGTTKAVSVVNNTAAYRGGINRSSYDQYLDTDIFKTDLGKPRTSVSLLNMRKYAANNKGEVLCYEFYKWIFYWNYVIEYANRNCLAAFNANLNSEGYHQGGLGSGVTTLSLWSDYNNLNPITPCGYGNSIGNGTGVLKINIPEFTYGDNNSVLKALTLSMPRWRGFDNPFGDIWTILEGIIYKFDSDKNENAVYTTDDVNSFSDVISNKTLIAYETLESAKYVSKISFGTKGDLIATECNASSTTYFCDYHYTNNSTSLRLARVGGGANYGGAAGLGCFDSNAGLSWTYSDAGFRVIKRIN